MADKPSLATLSGNAIYSAATLNAIFDDLATAIENCLGRGGIAESPNSMAGTLDMDMNKIQNLPAPNKDRDAVNKEYVDSLIAAAAVGDVNLVSGDALISSTRVSGYGIDWDAATAVPATDRIATWDGMPVVDVRFHSLVGDDSTDNATYLQNLIDTVDAGSTILFPAGTYQIKTNITVDKALTFIGDGTLKIPTDYVPVSDQMLLFDISADNVTFKNLSFFCDGVKGDEDNAFIWNSEGYCKVLGCTFEGIGVSSGYFGGAVALLAGGAGYNKIQDCTFINCPGGGFSQQPHTIMTGNQAINPTDVSFVLNSEFANYGILSNNTVSTDGVVVCAAHLVAENGPNYFVISNNTVNGVDGGLAIGAIDVGGYSTVGSGGIISNNIINSALSVSAGVGIVVHSYFHNVKVFGNIINGIKDTGIQVAVDDVEVYENTISGATTQAIRVSGGVDAGGYLHIHDNKLLTSGSYGVVMGSAFNYATTEIKIEDNYFDNMAVGIHTRTCLGIGELIIKDNICKATNYVDMVNIYDSVWMVNRLNVYNKTKPHFISSGFVEMWSYSASPSPTDGTFWQVGSIIRLVDPSAAAYTEYVRVAGPQWKGRNQAQA